MIFIPLSDNTHYFIFKLALLEPMLIVHSSFYDAAAIVADLRHFPIKVVLLPILIQGSFYNFTHSSEYVKIIVTLLIPGSRLTSCPVISSVFTILTHVGKAQFMFMSKKKDRPKFCDPPQFLLFNFL